MPIGATIAAATATAGASIYSANKSSKATKAASAAATNTAADNNALQREIYGQNKALIAPYAQHGYWTANQTQNLLQTNPYQTSTGKSFQEDPGTNYIRQQALDQVTAQQALGGNRLSGGAMKALQDRAAGIASTTYGDWWNRDQAELGNINNSRSNYLNDLSGVTNRSIGAASALAGVGQNFAGATGSNNWQAANVQGNAALAGANTSNQLINNLMNTGANAFGQYQQSRSSYGAPAAPPGYGYNMPGWNGSMEGMY